MGENEQVRDLGMPAAERATTEGLEMDETSRLARQCAYTFMVLRVVPAMVVATSLGLLWVR